MKKRENKPEVIITKKRTTTLTITFEYKKGSVVPDEIHVNGSQCSMAEMMLGLMRMFATIEEKDSTSFLAEAFERVIEYGIEKGRFVKQGTNKRGKLG